MHEDILELIAERDELIGRVDYVPDELIDSLSSVIDLGSDMVTVTHGLNKTAGELAASLKEFATLLDSMTSQANDTAQTLLYLLRSYTEDGRGRDFDGEFDEYDD